LLQADGTILTVRARAGCAIVPDRNAPADAPRALLPSIPQKEKGHPRVALLRELPDDVLLSQASCSLSSALRRFTVLFGMGRSGSTALWSSGMTCCFPARRQESQFARDIGSVLERPARVRARGYVMQHKPAVKPT